MNEVHSQLLSWFASPLDAQSSHELASIIRSCEATLEPVWHPLGFIHVKLAQSEKNDSFRMHVWSRDYRDALEQADKVHDHLFDVRSRVVFGSIKNVRYRFTKRTDGSHREVRVTYAPNDVSLSDSKLYGDLEEVGADVLQAPVEYVVPRYELHETFLHASALALTVVHTTEPQQYRPRAIFRRNAPLTPSRRPVPCDRSLWQKLLEQMLPL